MSSRYRYILVLMIGLIIGASGFWLVSHYRSITQADKFDQVLSLIEKYYVDSVDIDDLRTATIPYLLGALDPHSVYIPPVKAELETQRLEGRFEGIGVIYNVITDTIVVDHVFEDGPSELAGIKPGDRILACGNRSLLAPYNNQDSISAILRGPEGSVADLLVQRGDAQQTISVVRGGVPIKSIDAAFLLTPQIALIRINSWTRTTYDEFIQAYSGLQKAGAKALIIDLCDNPGGYMDSAIAVANEFLSEGHLIVYTEGRTVPRENTYATGSGILQQIPLAVLINENSASSSEIFAGAMQDHDRASIIGRQSYGKGLVQNPFTFPDHSTVRLTVARYYTPSGRNIQRPYEQGSLASIEESLSAVSDIKPKVDRVAPPSLIKKKEYRSDKGRLLYSGYGIMPDIFVPQTESLINAYAARLIMSGYMQEFAFYYVDANRQLIDSFDTVIALEEYLRTQRHLLSDLAAYAAEAGLEQRPQMLHQAAPRLTQQLHALIVNNRFGTSGFYQVMSHDDPIISRAQEQLQEQLEEL